MSSNLTPSPSSRRNFLRSVATVGLACMSVSIFFHLRLHGNYLSYQNSSIQASVMASLPEKAPPETDNNNDVQPLDRSVPVDAVKTEEDQQTSVENEPPSQSTAASDGPSQYSNSTSPFAYGFVIGGCDPKRPATYQNYLFNIAIAAQILRERGSTADVVALFQVSKTAETQELLPQDLKILHGLGVYVYYIPQQTYGKQSFYRTQLDKFRILGLSQYERILFMDGDVMPLANLDYLLEMSASGKLKDNVVLQGIHEPANGGFFMLRPGPIQDMQKIIEWRERFALESPYPYFDPVIGWGQVLTEDDKWVAKAKSGTNWTFLAAFADQGLLYYYTKYHQKSVSILMRSGAVENWGEVNTTLPNGTVTSSVRLIETLQQPFDHINSSRVTGIPGRHNHFKMPTNSMVHFTGNKKPWMGGGPPEDCCHNATSCCDSEETKFKSAKHYWYFVLARILKALKIDINFAEHWKEKHGQRPPLGLYPTWSQVLNASSYILTPLSRVYPESPEDYKSISP